MGVRVVPGRDPAAVERLLRGLPEWFGIESATAEYVGAAGRLPGLLAYAGDEPVGALLLERHFPTAALGFQPVEELLDLWPGNPCLLMVKPL